MQLASLRLAKGYHRSTGRTKLCSSRVLSSARHAKPAVAVSNRARLYDRARLCWSARDNRRFIGGRSPSRTDVSDPPCVRLVPGTFEPNSVPCSTPVVSLCGFRLWWQVCELVPKVVSCLQTVDNTISSTSVSRGVFYGPGHQHTCDVTLIQW